MVIRRISCTQFAGVCDRDVSLSDGINIIYGKNESGKSTLVNLLFKTLFQNARVDGRSDKDFVDQYFPSAKKGAVSGDYIDGKVSIETDEGTYTLSKEWGSDSRCVLSTPEGAIRDRDKIEEILKGILLYGEGVYSDLLFSSQKNTDSALRTLLDASDKKDAKSAKQEIANAVTLAFAESDGITTDSIEKAIDEKIDEIAGKHWDFERNAPAKNRGPEGGQTVSARYSKPIMPLKTQTKLLKIYQSSKLTSTAHLRNMSVRTARRPRQRRNMKSLMPLQAF